MAEIEKKASVKTDDFKSSDVKEVIKEVKNIEDKSVEKKPVQEVKPIQQTQPIQSKKRMGKLKCFIGRDALIITQDGKGITMPNKAYIGKKPGTMVEY